MSVPLEFVGWPISSALTAAKAPNEGQWVIPPKSKDDLNNMVLSLRSFILDFSGFHVMPTAEIEEPK